MPERPLILFPQPEKREREKKNSVPFSPSFPSVARQFSRLQSPFDTLNAAFTQKAISLQASPTGINPEFALVFEIIGTVDNFYTAVKNTDGLEWIFDKASFPSDPDDDFYQINKKTGERSSDPLTGKIYCIMSNQRAMTQMLSLWQRYSNGETNVFKRGCAGLRDIFRHIKDIRKWNAQDRIAETSALEYWRQSLIEGEAPVKFEIELFFRSNEQKRRNATNAICNEIQALNGRIIQECIICDIYYHALLVELPRTSIEALVNRYEDISLTQVDDIMFFRPTCQSAFVSTNDTQIYTGIEKNIEKPTGEAVVAVFDGMPMQNHHLLRERVIIDDPDNYEAGYESNYRRHGTSMVSLVIYGDLQKNEEPISSPVYVRPILKPRQGFDEITEVVSEDCLFVDILHRSVKRMMEGDGGETASAPNTKIINLSVGDPVRQLASIMSPAARLLDFLSYKYQILFIISAGNHPEILEFIGKSFDELKSLNIIQRNKLFGKTIQENQRNLKILSPAENLNGLTIGALYDDFTEVNENEHCIWAIDKGLPSPISSFGNGYRSIITPDLFYYGGRKFIKGDFRGNLNWAASSRPPGCKSAAPYEQGKDGCTFSFGTSDATAQITHEAVKCYEVLNQVFSEERGANIPVNAIAILLKAMLTHGASWDNIADKLASIMDTPSKKLSQWLGNGIPDITRVMECTKERITLIGLGALKKDEGEIFKLPLPIDFSSRLIKRKLTVTLSYLSPISPNRQAYRGAQLWFNIDDGDKKLVPNRQNTDWNAVRKGTLQHEIFIGESPVVWNNDDLIIKVNCKEEAGKIKTPIDYALFVSFEIAEGFDVDLYAAVSEKIRQRIKV